MGQIIYKKVEYTGSGGGGGSDVQYESELAEGVKVGALTIDGTENDILVPPQEDEIIEITKSEYDKLTPAEKQDKTFCINDWTPDETLGGSYNGPIGEIISYMGTTAPTNFLVCDGSIYNISDYTDLANHINKHFGSFNFFGGDGTITFAVPDLRGEFLRGSGTNGHADSGNGADVGVHQNGTQIPQFQYYRSDATSNNFLFAMDLSPTGTSYIKNQDVELKNSTGRIYKDVQYTATKNDSDRNVTYARIVRPTNTSVLYCIRYREAGSGGNVSTKGRIDGVVYINDIPITLSKGINVYIDYNNGDDENGDGSSSKPLKTWGFASTLLPHNLGGFNLSLHISGNDFVTSKRTLTFTGYSNGTLCLTPDDSSQRYYRIVCTKIDRFNIEKPCIFDMSTNTSDWLGCILAQNSDIVVSANTTFIGSADLSGGGIGHFEHAFEAADGGNIYLADGKTFTVKNVAYVLKVSAGGNLYVRGTVNFSGCYAAAAAWCGRIAYTSSYVTGNTSKIETFSGGKVDVSTNW